MNITSIIDLERFYNSYPYHRRPFSMKVSGTSNRNQFSPSTMEWRVIGEFRISNERNTCKKAE
jgi:hypothetical protein